MIVFGCFSFGLAQSGKRGGLPQSSGNASQLMQIGAEPANHSFALEPCEIDGLATQSQPELNQF
jgi:hypothetical protein